MESDGLLFSQRTSGRFVTEDVGKIMQVKNALAMDLIHEFIDRMSNLGYDKMQAIAFIQQIAEEDK